MNISPWGKKRLMVPRWRSIGATVAAGELSAPAPRHRPHTYRPFTSKLRARLERWRLEGTTIAAAELVESAILERHEPEAFAAARFLAAESSTATPAVKKLAYEALRRAGHPEVLVAAEVDSLHLWRQRTRDYPQNPIAWVELSRHQMITGRTAAAVRSMTVAVQLAPNNRHVLRSAAHLFLLADDRERAHDVIVRSPATASDPWLLSSELVFAELAKRRPRFVRNARQVADDDNLPFRQVTEVAGALATEELTNGSRKKARRLFGRSMQDPNGNALAQAEWASPSFGTEIVPSVRFTEVSEGSEALAFHLFHEEKLSEVPAICEEWARNEPCSVRPYEFGSSTAGMIDDFERCEKLARNGLVIRPDDPLLLNNLAFALASNGQAEAALKTLSHLNTGGDDRQALVALANRGLAHFRLGRTDRGRSLYEEAIQKFEQQGDQRFAATAQVYLAREAVRARSADHVKLLKAAQARSDKLRWQYLSKLVAETAALLDAPASNVKSDGKSAEIAEAQ